MTDLEKMKEILQKANIEWVEENVANMPDFSAILYIDDKEYNKEAEEAYTEIAFDAEGNLLSFCPNIVR